MINNVSINLDSIATSSEKQQGVSKSSKNNEKDFSTYMKDNSTNKVDKNNNKTKEQGNIKKEDNKNIKNENKVSQESIENVMDDIEELDANEKSNLMNLLDLILALLNKGDDEAVKNMADSEGEALKGISIEDILLKKLLTVVDKSSEQETPLKDLSHILKEFTDIAKESSGEITKLIQNMDVDEVKEVPKAIVDVIKNLVNSEITTKLEMTSQDNGLNEIKEQLKYLLSTEDNGGKQNHTPIKEENKVESKVENKVEGAQVKIQDNKASLSTKEQSGENKSFNKDSEVLDKLLNSDDGKSKVTRVNDFMSTLQQNVEILDNIGVEKPSPITKSNLVGDVIKNIVYMDKNGMKDLTVKIYPKELGEVVISVSMEQGALKANIKANNKEALELLNLGLRDINEKISTNNIKIQSVDISLYNEDTTYFTNEDGRGEGFNNQGKKQNDKSSLIFDEDITQENMANDISEVDLFV